MFVLEFYFCFTISLVFRLADKERKLTYMLLKQTRTLEMRSFLFLIIKCINNNRKFQNKKRVSNLKPKTNEKITYYVLSTIDLNKKLKLQ